MNRALRVLSIAGTTTAALLGAFALPGGATARAQDPRAADDAADRAALAQVTQVRTKDLCASRPGEHYRCLSKVVADDQGNPIRNDAPLASGYGPSDFRSAYKLPSSGGNGKVVAIVDAYDAPNAESDLAKYRSNYGLPPCTTANGCFKKVNQSGQPSPLPMSDSGWAGEIMLDLDMVSAVCPDCHILLVEADTADTKPLGTAVNTAVSMGAIAVSNSYGGAETDPMDANYPKDAEQYYVHPGTLIVAATGDSGAYECTNFDQQGNCTTWAYGGSYPATSAGVLAVGGTTLTKSGSSRGWAETAWNYTDSFFGRSGGGSGCSAFIPKPAWQTDTICKMRMEADVSVVADPSTGVAVYDGGWQVVGGTSAASPIVAAAYALLGLEKYDLSFAWNHPDGFYDITSGTSSGDPATDCNNSYECVAGAGYDGPTGWGSLNGTVLATYGGGSGGTDAGSGGIDAGGGGTDAGGGGTDAGGGGTDAGGGGNQDSGSSGGMDAGGGGNQDAGLTPPRVDAGAHVDAGTGGTGGNGDNPDNTSATESSGGCSTSAAGAGSSAFGAGGLLLALAMLARRRRAGRN